MTNLTEQEAQNPLICYINPIALEDADKDTLMELLITATREQAIELLQWNDKGGCYNDAEHIYEFGEPMSELEAKLQVMALFVPSAKSTYERISDAFSKEVQEALTPEQIAEVIAKNNTDEYQGVCATHDYVDANMLMDAAFKSVTKREIDLQNKNDVELWGWAWNLSKNRSFKTA